MPNSSQSAFQFRRLRQVFLFVFAGLVFGVISNATVAGFDVETVGLAVLAATIGFDLILVKQKKFEAATAILIWTLLIGLSLSTLASGGLRGWGFDHSWHFDLCGCVGQPPHIFIQFHLCHFFLIVLGVLEVNGLAPLNSIEESGTLALNSIVIMVVIGIAISMQSRDLRINFKNLVIEALHKQELLEEKQALLEETIQLACQHNWPIKRIRLTSVTLNFWRI
jgi:hypothetical protein